MADPLDFLVRSVGDVIAGAFATSQPVEPLMPWAEARSLDAELGAPMEYPVDCLPPIIRDAVKTYQHYGQQPMALVGSSALSAVSLACQGLADVGRDENLIGPCSLSFLTIAESGERKTACDKRFSQPLREWQASKEDELKPRIRIETTRHEAWETKKKVLTKELEKALSTEAQSSARRTVDSPAEGPCIDLTGGAGILTGDLASDRIQKQLEDHSTQEPTVHPPIHLFMEDTNLERLAQDIASGWPTLSLRSDEGGLVIGAHGLSPDRAMAYLAFLNRLWDGNSFDQRRIGRGIIHVEGRRMTVSLMMQEVVLTKLMGVDAGAARGTGALARFLIAAPISTAGTRLFRQGKLDAPELLQFDHRIKELLSMPLPITDEWSYILNPPVLYLDAEAFELWRQFHDFVERSLTPCGEFNEMKDFAAKSAEQAARLAGLFHVFENGPIGEISRKTMLDASMLAWYHLNEARRCLGLVGSNETRIDAEALLKWLVDRPKPVSARDILSGGPNRVRKAKRRDFALAKLFEHGLVRKEIGPSGTVIAVHPAWRQSAPANTTTAA